MTSLPLVPDLDSLVPDLDNLVEDDLKQRHKEERIHRRDVSRSRPSSRCSCRNEKHRRSRSSSMTKRSKSITSMSRTDPRNESFFGKDVDDSNYLHIEKKSDRHHRKKHKPVASVEHGERKTQLARQKSACARRRPRSNSNPFDEKKTHDEPTHLARRKKRSNSFEVDMLPSSQEFKCLEQQGNSDHHPRKCQSPENIEISSGAPKKVNSKSREPSDKQKPSKNSEACCTKKKPAKSQQSSSSSKTALQISERKSKISKSLRKSFRKISNTPADMSNTIMEKYHGGVGKRSKSLDDSRSSGRKSKLEQEIEDGTMSTVTNTQTSEDDAIMHPSQGGISSPKEEEEGLVYIDAFHLLNSKKNLLDDFSDSDSIISYGSCTSSNTASSVSSKVRKKFGSLMSNFKKGVSQRELLHQRFDNSWCDLESDLWDD